MRHLGDITKLDGAKIPPVDVITGGSPCQDLSTAGNRKGLAGERSGLFLEQCRLVKEMRNATANDNRGMVRPRYMVWENVPGAFSSNEGKDFASVLTEIIRIAEPGAPAVPMPAGTWSKAGCIYDDLGGWSVAWRLHDAQFWGVPQRRKRIALVADFGGLSAPEVLFERKGMQRDLGEDGAQREGAAGDRDEDIAVPIDGMNGINRHDPDHTLGVGENGDPMYTLCASQIHGVIAKKAIPVDVDQTGCGDEGDPAFTLTSRHPQSVMVIEPRSQDGVPRLHDDIVPTLNTAQGGQRQPCVLQKKAYCISSAESNAMNSKNPNAGFYEAETARCLDQNGGNPSCNQGGTMVLQPKAYSIQGSMIGRSDKNGPQGDGINEDVSFTLNTVDRHGVVYKPYTASKNSYMTEFSEDCANTLVATDYKDPPLVVDQIDEEYVVRRLTPLECERLQGFSDNWTDIGDWVDSEGKKHKANDSARYKALGNSIALPFWFYLMRRIAAQYERPATLGSLFDGIGGFPYVWESCNGKGTAVWASEIEEFPMAVTKIRFPEGGGNDPGIH